MLSPNVKEELLEASSHLRAALRNSSTNEKAYVCRTIATLLMTIESLEQAETLMDKIDPRNPLGPFQF